MKITLRVLSCMSIAVIGSTCAAFTPASELQGMRPATPTSGPDAVFFFRPLVFEPNQGQCNSNVRFVARGARFDTFLTDTGATLVLRNVVESPSSQVHIALVGARPGVKAVAFDRLPGTSNYFIGNEPSNHITDVPNFAQVRYESV